MTSGIYCIRHIETDMRYIGKSINIERRFVAHRYYLSNPVLAIGINRHLWNAVRKYGIESFVFEVIEIVCAEHRATLAERELHWMAVFASTDRRFGYNLRADSSSGMIVHDETRKLQAENAVRIHTGRRRSEETCRRLSESLKGKLIGRKQSPEHIAARTAAMIGKRTGPTLTPEQRERQRLAASNPRSDETKRKISEAKLGKKASDEARANMSKARKGKPLSDEHRKKLSESGKGRIQSEETRLKMSIAAKARWAAHKGNA